MGSKRLQQLYAVITVAAATVVIAAWINSAGVLRQLSLSVPDARPHSLEVASSGPTLFPDSCLLVTSTAFDQLYKRGGWGASAQKIEDFYSNAEWPPKRRKSASGGGSDLGNAKISMQVLRETIQKYNVKSMIDLPCGDANWIFDSWETDSLELYIGLDIAEQVVELNSKRFHHHSNKLFRHWDGSKCPLPKFRATYDSKFQSVDLVHSRDVLQHMFIKRGIQFLCHVFQSGARLFVTTTYPGGVNRDISAEGRFYRNDLSKAPFDLPNVKSCLPTHPEREPDWTCVYNLTEPWVVEWVAQKCSSGNT